ncbi:MAG: ATP-binding protein [Pseudomonadota bacterium]
MLNEYPFLAVYNPWWEGAGEAWEGLPAFRRDVFDDLYADVVGLPQMISVTGPRRVGKSTLLKQCIRQLIADNGPEQAKRIVYFTMDDPALSLPHVEAHRFFDDLVTEFAKLATDGTVYLFLDEIQKFPRWELYLKKYYDLKTPVRFVVSGSASAPIFKKSHESLLGRIKAYRALPFSFREFFYFRYGSEETRGHSRLLLDFGSSAQRTPGDFVGFLSGILESGSFSDYSGMRGIIDEYFYEGGFPEVWNLPNILAKQEYLYQNQIERVIFEDLLVAAEFRKPEMLRRFYLGLLAEPGRETNLTRLSSEIQINRSTIESYFPLLEATDLVWRLQKYTGGKASHKAGNFKTYLVDLAVRNAVMKLSPEALLADEALMGLYAENVVANHLRRWPGLVELAYFRERSDELDFVVDLGAARIGIEVKYRNSLNEGELAKSAAIAAKLKCAAFAVVCWQKPTEGWIEKLRARVSLPVAIVPLADFMMLF